MSTANATSNAASLTVKRAVKAPRDLVFGAFADAAALSAWWGPMGFTMTVTEFTFKPGGHCLFKMENGDTVMWAKLVYGAIERPDRLEITLSFSNESGGLTRAPFFAHWPAEIINVFTFTEQDGITTITNQCCPVDATDAEVASFEENKHSVRGGLEASMDKLAVLLEG
ncbi:SRPBCC family protein [Paraflavitalea pollutisoli]|uniref:SRPBCC family protein n=1 Tax=Paraflavitalea pollutisoli TaxID=3034143 RepID=UPI0023EE0894|nr:SRPBCC domain-containing protein [Paraflavitalea sp. H1-2-19X]